MKVKVICGPLYRSLLQKHLILSLYMGNLFYTKMHHRILDLPVNATNPAHWVRHNQLLSLQHDISGEISDCMPD